MFAYYSESGVRLERAHDGDIGWDLRVTEGGKVHPGEVVRFSTGVRIALRDGYWAEIASRSGVASRGLHIIRGIIDTGYRGELFISAWRPSDFDSEYEVAAGERLAQLIVHSKPLHDYCVQVDDLYGFQRLPPVGERGERGFGSSGR